MMSGPKLAEGNSFGATLKKTVRSANKKQSYWKRGNVVRVRPGAGYRSYEGKNAVVLSQDGDQVLIQFDQEMPGLHDGHGNGIEGRCWFLSSSHILHYNEARVQERAEDVQQSEQQDNMVKAHKTWKRGTLVRMKKDVGWNQYINVDATVLEQVPGEEEVLIQFSRRLPQLHDGDGKGRPERCLYVGDNQIQSYFQDFAGYNENVSVSDEEAPGRDEGPTEEAREDGVVESMWPDFGIVAKVDETAEEYHRQKAVDSKIRMVLGDDAPDEPPEPEDELEEVEEESSSSKRGGFAEQYRMGVVPRTHSIGGRSKKVSIKPSSVRILREGGLCKVQKANGDRTIYDNMAAVVVGQGKFGRFLLQFEQKVRGGHDGKGIGEPGRCRWFYKKDVASINMGEAISLGKRQSGRPKPKFNPSRGASWKPSGEHYPNQSSGSMWDIEEVPQPKKAKKGLTFALPTSGRMMRGARVMVHSPPSDNKALKGKQGVIISDTGGNNVTVQFDEKISGCHDANGHGKQGRCWNLHKMLLKPMDGDVILYIKEDYKRGSKNLKDMEVKILAHITHPTDANESSSVVEFTEEIPQGHSADGKGKKAHCLSVPASIIGKRKKEQPKEIKKPYEVTAKREAKKK